MASNSNDREDSIIITFGETVFNLMVLDFLWIICSLLIVTIGASTAALNYTCIKLRRDEGDSLIKMFFHSFKINFRQALIMGTVMLALLIILVAGLIQAVGNLMAHQNFSLLFLLLVLLGLFVWLIFFAFLFMVQCRFDNPMKDTVRNAFYLILTNFRTALKIGGIEMMLLIFGPIFLWEYFPYGFPMVIFFAVPLTAYILAKIFNDDIFEEYVPKET